MNFLKYMLITFFFFSNATAWMNIQRAPALTTTDRIVSFLIRMWTNTVDLVNGVGYSVIVYSTTETIVFFTLVITCFLAYKYLWRGRHDTQKTTVQVISTMHVNNSNRERKRGDDGRLPQIVTNVIKCPDLSEKAWMANRG